MTTIATGGTELNGINRVEIPIPAITLDCKIVLRSVSAAMKGVVVVSEITAHEGFALSSTSPEDVGMTVYFDVFLPSSNAE